MSGTPPAARSSCGCSPGRPARENHDPVVIRVPGRHDPGRGSAKAITPAFRADECPRIVHLHRATQRPAHAPRRRIVRGTGTRISHLGSEVALNRPRRCLSDRRTGRGRADLGPRRIRSTPHSSTRGGMTRWTTRTLDAIAAGHRIVVTIEDGQLDGRLGREDHRILRLAAVAVPGPADPLPCDHYAAACAQLRRGQGVHRPGPHGTAARPVRSAPPDASWTTHPHRVERAPLGDHPYGPIGQRPACMRFRKPTLIKKASTGMTYPVEAVIR